MYSFVKIDQTIHLRSMNFTLYKLYINKQHLRKEEIKKLNHKNCGAKTFLLVIYTNKYSYLLLLT